MHKLQLTLQYKTVPTAKYTKSLFLCIS